MPEEKKKLDIRFVDKGDKVVMKQDIPDVEMDDKTVMVEIDGLQNAVEKGKLQLDQVKIQQTQIEEGIKQNSERLKDLKRFEDKMSTVQESKAKTIFEEIKEECRKKVEKEYTTDDALTEFENGRQKWRIYQQTIATHKRAAEELAPKIMQKMYYKESILNDPWNNIKKHSP